MYIKMSLSPKCLVFYLENETWNEIIESLFFDGCFTCVLYFLNQSNAWTTLGLCTHEYYLVWLSSIVVCCLMCFLLYIQVQKFENEQ